MSNEISQNKNNEPYFDHYNCTRVVKKKGKDPLTLGHLDNFDNESSN
jgi:hypothetical protein